MNETEIKTAIESCKSGDCVNCPLKTKAYKNKCMDILFESVIALINRKNAEIESLEREIPKYAVRVKVKNDLIYSKTLEDYDWLIGDISAEAIKEFAERVIKHIKGKAFNLKLMRSLYTDQSARALEGIAEDIDQIAKEMGVEL